MGAFVFYKRVAKEFRQSCVLLLIMDNNQDTELIALALEGESSAFETLVNRYYKTVYRYAFRWAGVKADAEDIAQEVFIKLANHLHTFSGQSSFSTWLYRVTANCAMDFARKNYRHHRNRTDNPGNEHFVSANPGPEAKSYHEQVLSAVHQLPLKLKEASLLVFAEGMSHKEAARVLGCAEATVSWRIFQAKKKLQKVLA